MEFGLVVCDISVALAHSVLEASIPVRAESIFVSLLFHSKSIVCMHVFTDH